MIFPTVPFAGFFALVLPTSWLLMPHRRLWKLFIIAASYYFYSYAGSQFVFLIAACTIWSQSCASLLSLRPSSGDESSKFGSRIQDLVDMLATEKTRKWIVAIGVAGDLSVLAVFKYYGFFVSNVVSVTHAAGLPAPVPLVQLGLPVGISFFTFQAISYIVDVKRDRSALVQWLDFGAYLSFFPHLIAGPIVRVSELVPQFMAARDPRRIEFSRAMELIVFGLVKKVLLADFIGTQIVDPVFSSPGLHSRTDTIVAIYGYAAQIYCDFSGYTDIAIGLALLMGFQFPQNFNKPYAALSVTEFWHRWHMTLSRWLRDYLYIPLGGNRQGRKSTYRNLMLTMLLGGLWHGAAWNFVIWGGMHGSALAAERWWEETRGSLSKAMPAFARWFLTFNFVCLAWIFFRSDSLQTVGAVLGQLFAGKGVTTVSPALLLAIFAGIGVHFVPQRPALALRLAYSRLSPVWQGVSFACVVLFIGAVLTGQGVAPFIYYRF